MNFFFGINNDIFKSELQIPNFQNKELKPSQLSLFKCYPKNHIWTLDEIVNRKVNDYFYILNQDDISSKDIYFLADRSILKNFNKEFLENYNSFTDTDPAFRANFKIFIPNAGFSSFQSEYPYAMIRKLGNIVSAVNSLANVNADQNYILLRNIFIKPVEEIFYAYLIDYKKKRIEEKFELHTNNTNLIEIKKEYIKPEIFFATQKYLGIPIYASKKNNFLSFEHTHPPHEYILSNNKYLKVKELKTEINEIINKENS